MTEQDASEAEYLVAPSADDREMAMAESSLNGKQLLEAAVSI